MDDLLGEIRSRAKKQRVLVTTLTKRMAEDLTDYLAENEVRVRYLHPRFIRSSGSRSSRTFVLGNMTFSWG